MSESDWDSDVPDYVKGDAYFDRELHDAIQYDRKNVFVKMLNQLTSEEVKRLDPLHSVFFFDSVNCLKAVLDGKTAGLFEITDVNAVPFTRYDEQLVPILHKAARSGSLKITKFFLPRLEAQVNLRIDVEGMKGVLPLNLVLRTFWSKFDYGDMRLPHERKDMIGQRYWISQPSPKELEPLLFKWIFHLTNPVHKRNAELVRLLASKTLEIEQEFLKYLNERKLFELMALLMFARDRVMPGLEGSSKIRDIVVKEIATLKMFIFRSTYDVDSHALVCEAQQKKMEMEAILLLLEIFDRIGDRIDAYLLHYDSKGDSQLDSVRKVSWLLKEAGFDAELELLDETSRFKMEYDHLHIIIWGQDYHKDNRVEESNTEMNRLSNGEPDEKDNSYQRAPDKPLTDDESKQASKRWVVNKQEMLSKLPSRDSPFSLRLYHTYHFMRDRRGFSSTMANKVGGSDIACQSFQPTYHFALGSTTTSDIIQVSNNMASKFAMKKQDQDCNKCGRRRTRVCSWASELKFTGESILSANSSRRVLWITNKLGRVL
ncbi:OLC1v1037682C1 [Oldenlandia corymbosa var. corymbosa]|uniref:OLC1v1037682C1 n=1 Tax=Oldenlandia corymbosa var. corymbosa TaxID=529605 RepID=A0AAV1CXX3_OLDCO|nr:OLC1v1037682C1 [Oldenlandia corymbosa var. corymbosa]